MNPKIFPDMENSFEMLVNLSLPFCEECKKVEETLLNKKEVEKL